MTFNVEILVFVFDVVDELDVEELMHRHSFLCVDDILFEFNGLGLITIFNCFKGKIIESTSNPDGDEPGERI